MNFPISLLASNSLLNEMMEHDEYVHNDMSDRERIDVVI